MTYKPIKTETGWGVMLKAQHDGRQFLALSGHGGHFFSVKRNGAVVFRNELRPHVQQKGKVVPIRVTYEVGE